jgi:prevent-host-death family protein
MAKLQRRGAEEARSQLPALLADAEKGTATVITRHGRSVAVLTPVDQLRERQASLLALAGSGKGLWGRDSRQSLRRMRDEWNR